MHVLPWPACGEERSSEANRRFPTSFKARWSIQIAMLVPETVLERNRASPR